MDHCIYINVHTCIYSCSTSGHAMRLLLNAEVRDYEGGNPKLEGLQQQSGRRRRASAFGESGLSSSSLPFPWFPRAGPRAQAGGPRRRRQTVATVQCSRTLAPGERWSESPFERRANGDSAASSGPVRKDSRCARAARVCDVLPVDFSPSGTVPSTVVLTCFHYP